MAVARLQQEFDYVLEAERELPPEKRTVWHLRTLNYATHREVMRTSLKLSDGGDQLIDLDKFGIAWKVLNYGLRGWAGFRDAAGVEMECKRCADGTLAPQTLDMLVDVAVELSNAITERGTAQKDHAKNSTSP